MVEGESAGTVGELLAERRRRRFVGRRAELDVLRDALTGGRQPIRVLYVHGPGGIGKSSLLRMYGDLATDLGVKVVRIDGRSVEPTPAAVRDVAGDVAGAAVLLVDTFEELAVLDDWFRTDFLPGLPADVLTVLAGREPPGAEWLADPGWSELLQVVPLRNLDRDECRQYLQARGVPDESHDRSIDISHGHPLGLSLLADLVASGGEAVEDPLTPDLVATLLSSFVDVVPTGSQRAALEICALARTTNEALLRDGLGVEDARDLFTWLRGLSFIESGPDGLAPHELAREALIADLRWRDPEAYDWTFRRIQAHVLGRLRTSTGRQQQRFLYDAKYMHRHQGIGRGWVDWDSFGRHYPDAARPGDLPGILELIGRWEGGESAAIAEHWWRQQPEAFQVVRDHTGGLRGVLVEIDLTRATDTDVSVDRGAVAALRHAESAIRRRADEVVTQLRFAVDREAYQDASPTVNLGPVLSIQHWLGTPRLAAAYLTFHQPERREEFLTFYEIPRAVGADFEVGGRSYGLFVRDFHRLRLDDWLQVMFDRDLAGDPGPSHQPARAEPVLLSQADFAQGVRAALRDLRRPDALARNPLVRSALVLERAQDGDATEQLAALVRRTVERLADDERDHKLYRVLDRTYLRPAPTQERAAELLDLPLSTYKRHLSRGVERVIADLWHQELEH
ncbi:AAA family ATPase [Kribbella swartbergensis]